MITRTVRSGSGDVPVNDADNDDIIDDECGDQYGDDLDENIESVTML